MSDSITLTGIVATDPRHVVTGTGLHITSFRFASNQRKYDRETGTWSDGDTNWYTVSTFRQLASNVVGSVHKGQRLLVTGRLRVREWTAGDKTGTSVEIDADSLGHDLTWGSSVFTRTAPSASAPAEFPSEGDGPTPTEGEGQEASSRSDDRDPAEADRRLETDDVSVPF